MNGQLQPHLPPTIARSSVCWCPTAVSVTDVDACGQRGRSYARGRPNHGLLSHHGLLSVSWGRDGRGGGELVTRRVKGILTCCTPRGPAMAESASSCSYCGKKSRVDLKRCARCKQASYCGAECQKAGWAAHKMTCALPPIPIEEVFDIVYAANAAYDWRGVLKWEGRMEELLEEQEDDCQESILGVFCSANYMARASTGRIQHALKVISLQERRIELLGTLQRFRDQGASICSVAESLLVLERRQEARKQYERARDVGAAHGFFSVECRACVGLGNIAMVEGRHDEGVDLSRNALAAANPKP